MSRSKTSSLLDRSLFSGSNSSFRSLSQSNKSNCQDVSLPVLSLLFVQMVQYSQDHSNTVIELQDKLHALGLQVGARALDLAVCSSANASGGIPRVSNISTANVTRETKVLQILCLIKTSLWKLLFRKEADKLERANDDERTFYIIETDHVLNSFISVPKDKGTLNCASFTAGIIEAALVRSNFPAKVSAHYHNGTTFMVKFDKSVMEERDRSN